MKGPVHITSAYLYAKAATALGFKHSYVKEGKMLLNIFSETKQILITENSLNLNSEESISTSRNKERTSKILQNKDIPVPRFTVFEDQKPALNYALKMMKKKTGIVIKPIAGSNAVGICINPQTSKHHSRF